MFEYRVKIRNTGKSGIDPSIQILSRHWYFLDWHTENMVEVVGRGVLGQFPFLHPEEEHCYTSGTDLSSQHGVMKGMLQVARFSPIPSSEADDPTPEKNVTEKGKGNTSHTPTLEKVSEKSKRKSSTGRKSTEKRSSGHTTSESKKDSSSQKTKNEATSEEVEFVSSPSSEKTPGPFIDMIDVFIAPTLFTG